MTLRIGHKIVAGFGLVILLTFGLGWFQLANIGRVAEISATVVEDDFALLRLIGDVGSARREGSLNLERAWTAHLLAKAGVRTDDPAALQKEWALRLERQQALIGELEALTSLPEAGHASETRRQLSEQLRALTREMAMTVGEISSTGEELFARMARDDVGSYASYHEVLARLRQAAAEQGARGEALALQLATSARQRILDQEADVRAASMIALGLVLLTGLVAAGLIHRSITNPLREFMRFVERVGSGDLTRKLENDRRDEIGHLGNHLNDMVDNLADAARQIGMATENLNTAAAEMQTSVQQHSAGTSEQSAAIQQITSTLSEIAQSGAQITERAKAVASTAEAAASASKSGLQSVNETTQAMDAIREQAEKVAGNVVSLTEKAQSIGAIIATVNDIAERSSLLALNAAIEAAAAGEQGLSFGVVADEIKNLASQAKDATLEVRSILGDIQQGFSTAVMQTEEAVKRVTSGKDQAVATERTINELTRSIEQSVATFEQIVAATNQQQAGIEQVTQSVHGIREASEQMSSGSQEVGRAATSLAALSSQLQKAVERYQV